MADVMSQTNGAGEHQNGENVQEAILKQVEYYFGDINLSKDKFMLGQIKLDDGWIPMSVMVKFQRLAKLSVDPKVIANALQDSKLMEVDDSGEEIKIRRSPDFPLEEITSEKFTELQSRSVYCKGFPQDYTMDDLINFFNKFGPYENIVMRKYKDKLSKSFKFKGSVFVTYATKEKAKEFLDLEDVKCNDKDLIRMWQLQHSEEKKQEYLNNKLKRAKKVPEVVEENDLKFPKGATLHLQGDCTDLTRENIKEKFEGLGYEIAFVEFNRGEKEAHIRLSKENSGKEFLEKEGKDVEIGSTKLEARLLEGEEEEKFLAKAKEDRRAYLRKCHQARQSGKKGKGRGGKGRNNKRKGGRDEADADSPPAKKQTVEGD